MVKVGYCQYELKAFRNARATLEQVNASYPGVAVAAPAKGQWAAAILKVTGTP